MPNDVNRLWQDTSKSASDCAFPERASIARKTAKSSCQVASRYSPEAHSYSRTIGANTSPTFVSLPIESSERQKYEDDALHFVDISSAIKFN
jgi:hypothetical protein